MAADVRDAVAGREPDIAVSPFGPAALKEVRVLDWDGSTGCLFGDAPAECLVTALELDWRAVHPHYDLRFQTDIVDEAHAEGLRIVAWGPSRRPLSLLPVDRPVSTASPQIGGISWRLEKVGRSR